MAAAGVHKWSLRLERAESSRLAWALAISLTLHLLAYGTYEAGQKLNVWERLHWPAWMPSARMLTEILKKKEALQLVQRQPQVPLMFVDVSPAQAVPEPPKNPKGYSDRNSVAANPEATKVSDMPKINGKRTEVIRTADVPREKFVPLQPAPAPQPPPKPPEPPKQEPKQQDPPKREPPKQEQPVIKPKPAYTSGDLVMAKPAPAPRKDEGDANEAKPSPAPLKAHSEAKETTPAPAPRRDESNATETKSSRPRTVKEALALQHDDRLPGEMMKQDGGVPRQALDPGFDVAASPFGAYDRALIEAVSHRWYSLLDQNAYVSNSRGKVVLQFHLHADGRITELNVAECTVGEMLSLLCQRAILDPQPFAAWPADMRRLLGTSRSIQFTFYYN